MIKTVIRTHRWQPRDIGCLFIDGIDWEGIEYLYDDINEVLEELKPKKKD